MSNEENQNQAVENTALPEAPKSALNNIISTLMGLKAKNPIVFFGAVGGLVLDPTNIFFHPVFVSGKIEDFGMTDLDKIPVVPKDYINQVSNFIEEVKSFTNEQNLPTYPDPNNIIHKDKMKFLNFLLSYFGLDVKNSFFIDRINRTGGVEERLVTDIAIPSMKINIEFPNTFWHNFDIAKANRDYKLKLMGWKIIDIKGTKPSIQDLKDALKKYDLI